MRNLTRAARLFEKLAVSGSNHGKVMAGIMYFRGEGVEVDRKRAKKYFEASKNDDLSEFMLLAMKYFEIMEKNTKP